jgi:hypothetical protein
VARFPERTAPKPISVLNDRTGFSRLHRYPVTKLLEIFIVNKIIKLSKASGIIVSTVNPAMCHSELNRDMPWYAGAIVA